MQPKVYSQGDLLLEVLQSTDLNLTYDLAQADLLILTKDSPLMGVPIPTIVLSDDVNLLLEHEPVTMVLPYPESLENLRRLVDYVRDLNETISLS